MANNRIQLYCTKCLELVSIAKYYPTAWVAIRNADIEMNDFFEYHEKKCFLSQKENWNNGEWGDNMFKFRTENDEDGFISDYSDKIYKLKKQ